MFWRKCYFVWTIGLHVISAALIGPNSTAVEVGSPATFTCTTNSSEPCFIWKYKATGAHEYKRLYNENLAPECKCNVKFRDNYTTSSLTINDVQLTNAGLYKCSDCWTRESSEATLTVLGKKLNHSYPCWITQLWDRVLKVHIGKTFTKSRRKRFF